MNPDYWFTTVDKVEAGFDPETNRAITQSGLKAWLDRCKAAPAEEQSNAPSQTRSVHPQNRMVSDNEPRDHQ